MGVFDITEAEYLADPCAGVDESGGKVAYRYVPGRNCPHCGSALEYIVQPTPRGGHVRVEQRTRSRRRRSRDAELVDRTVRVTPYTSKVVGTEWLHVYRYLCPQCGLLTESQASGEPEAEARARPWDYYVAPPPPAPVQQGLSDLF